MNRTLTLLALIVSTLTSCANQADRTAATAAAEQAVTKFHQQLDGGRFAEIYAGSSAILKQSASQQDFVAGLEAVHRKLGILKSTKEQIGLFSVGTPGTMVTLDYITTYSEGDANERFVFRIQDNAASLSGYFINSKAFMK